MQLCLQRFRLRTDFDISEFRSRARPRCLWALPHGGKPGKKRKWGEGEWELVELIETPDTVSEIWRFVGVGAAIGAQQSESSAAQLAVATESAPSSKKKEKKAKQKENKKEKKKEKKALKALKPMKAMKAMKAMKV